MFPPDSQNLTESWDYLKINHEFTELLTGKVYGQTTTHVYLPGLFGEGIFIYGTKMFWLHSCSVGMLVALLCYLMKTDRRLFFCSYFFPASITHHGPWGIGKLLILIVNYFLLFWPFLFILISRSLNANRMMQRVIQVPEIDRQMSRPLELMKMKLLKRLGLLASSLFLCLGLLEFLLRILAPLQWIFPVSDWTHQYGVIAYQIAKLLTPNLAVSAIHIPPTRIGCVGKWVSPHSCKRNLLLLGDSNVFGFGVQDHETIDARFNELTSSSPRMINMGNGGWSLPQAVRRYIDIGREFTPEGIILHMAGNDLEDPVYGINWVAYAKSDGSIGLRDIQRCLQQVVSANWLLRTDIPTS